SIEGETTFNGIDSERFRAIVAVSKEKMFHGTRARSMWGYRTDEDRIIIGNLVNGDLNILELSHPKHVLGEVFDSDLLYHLKEDGRREDSFKGSWMGIDEVDERVRNQKLPPPSEK